MDCEERLDLVVSPPRRRRLGNTKVFPAELPATHEEIAFDVYAALDELGHKIVHALRSLGVDFRPLPSRQHPVVVMQPHAVVAHPRESLRHFHRRFVVREIRVVAEIHAIEPLRHARQVLELEMSVSDNHPSELPCRPVDVRLRGKVQNSADGGRLDVLERNPVFALDHKLRPCTLFGAHASERLRLVLDFLPGGSCRHGYRKRDGRCGILKRLHRWESAHSHVPITCRSK